jgi:hypothetical protein
VRNAGLQLHTINTLPQDVLGSGSEPSHQQYLMLRAYSKSPEEAALLRTCHQKYGITDEMVQRAKATLGVSEEWARYLRVIETEQSMDNLREGDLLWPGSFAVPRMLQQQTATVRATPDIIRMQQLSSRSSRTTARFDPPLHLLPDAEDEVVPNAAAVTLLSQLLHMLPCDLEWVLNRVKFSAQFNLGQFSAQTDGVLKHKLNKEIIYAILEVKSRLRVKKTYQIIMQETCEVVGWLMSQSLDKAVFNRR